MLSALAAFPAFAVDPDSFRERVLLARDAQDDEQFHSYTEQMAREAGQHFAHTMRKCWTQSQRDPKPFVLVADIGADGRPHDVAVKPAHGAARCFASGFAAVRYLPPPEYPDRDGFPVMVRIGGHK
ncbi:hypothetical protein AYR66_17685 [Noviherbaspirillum denitrificans]|uniref:TonB C-terminal domain-containing protein n=1 Tax=Noviherbaspirillum denitrificans TaxID=1968433 RepID=A0A254TKA4_9BURK|nr:hypothetical protein AYR66_17685 [Noviherbaspirillum denitrificans]